MNKTLHISAITTIACLLTMRIAPYYEGIAFDKFWLMPTVILPAFLFAFITFIASATACVIAILRKKVNPNNLVVIGMLPILVAALYKAPLPNYVDGMYKTVKRTLPLNEIKEFSVEARESVPKWTNYEEHSQIIKKLQDKYQNALNLSLAPPRINVSDKYLTVFYGSALVKHWGYLVTDLDYFPIEHIPEGMYKEVYKGVWVYHDIW